MKLLIVDDDKDILNMIKIYLSSEGYEILEANNGLKALEILDKNPDIALIILDIMMPKLNGFDTCEKIRKKYTMPIIFLTAKMAEIDQILGFSSGGDDYIIKPFTPIDLSLRVKANIRRYFNYSKSNMDDSIIEIGDLCINTNAHIITKNKRLLKLTKTEFGILQLLVSNRGRIYSIEQIYEYVWNENCIINVDNTVSVHIKKLRDKIEDDGKNPKYIKTVWGVGYRVD
ncbi:MAG: response regulator transcription factor [Fusobacterium sp. JB021]|nr:response regulator transcription factor [Fusobacterium sp. JB020]MDP0494132.1 response regulator transcription factor [Fusobacterium sp. JB021]MDP0506236.1 response regulator transcription factor [Fusobacterium sp. JB019]